MITLPTEKKWSGDGWGGEPRLLFQVKRSEKNAIYRVTAFKTGKTTGYEVFKIKILPKGTKIFDAVTEDDEEKYPTAESFGRTAWTAATLKQAEERFDRLEQGLHPLRNAEVVVDDPIEEVIEVEDTKPKRQRGEKKVLNLPETEFSTKALADFNGVEYHVAANFMKEEKEANRVVFVRQERIGGAKRPTLFFKKA